MAVLDVLLLIIYWNVCNFRISRTIWNKPVKWLMQMHTKTTQMKG